RKESRRANLAGLDVELVEGDVRDPASLARAASGAGVVYHVAADYRLFTKDPRELFTSNVEGTRNVLRAAGDAGAERVVYPSPVGAVGLTPDGTPGTETTPVAREGVVGNYKRSKFDAERAAEELAREGVPVVIVNPSTPIGDLDVKPTPTGQMIV